MNNIMVKKLYFICLKNNKDDIINNISLFDVYIHNIKNVNDLDEINTTIISTLLINIDIFQDNRPNLSSFIIDKIKYILENKLLDIKNIYPTEEDIKTTINILAKYNYFKKIILSNNDIQKNNCNQISVKEYLNSYIHIYYIETLIKIISNNYLNISIEKIDFVLDLLLNNEFINNIINEKILYTLDIRNMLYLYLNQIINIKHMISKEEVENDIIIKAIRNKKIQDIDLIIDLIQNKNYYIIKRIFPNINDLINYILDLEYINIFDKEELIYIIISTIIIDEDNEYCTNFLYSDLKDNIHIKNVLDNNLKNKIINIAYKDIELSPDDIKLFFDNNLLDQNIIANSIYKNEDTKQLVFDFLINNNKYTQEQLDSTINSNDNDDVILKKLEIYNYNKKIVSYDVIIRMFTKHYNKEILLNIDQLRPLIRSFILNITKDNNTPLNDVVFNDYLDTNDSINGEFITKNNNNYIAINNNLLKLFLNPTLQVDKIKLFVTIYHELAHLNKSESIKKNFFDIKNYLILKESIIEKYNKGYYTRNYHNIIDEIEARTSGILSTKIMCSCIFPSLVEAVEKYEKTYNSKIDKNEFNNKYFDIQNNNVDFEKIFDRIMFLHSELLQEYPVLVLEYNTDGSKKTNEETKKISYINPTLAEEIIAKRYK